MRQKLFFWIRISVSLLAVLFVIITFRGRFYEVVSILRNLRWASAFLSFFLVIVSLALITARLRDILRAQDVNIDYRSLFCLTMIGLFFNNFLPSALGGDVVKAYYAGKHSKRKVEPYTSVFTDRVIGFVTFIFWSFFAVALHGKQIANPAIVHSVLIMGLVALILIMFFVSRRVARPYHWLVGRIPSKVWQQRMEKLYDGVNGYRKHPKLIVYAILLSIVAQFVMIMANWVLAKGLGLHISFGILMLVLPIIAIAQNAPSINGMGIREGAYVFFLGEYMTSEGALALAILFYLVYLAASLCGGIIYALRGGGVILSDAKAMEI